VTVKRQACFSPNTVAQRQRLSMARYETPEVQATRLARLPTH
jgi:hypothetical protein